MRALVQRVSEARGEAPVGSIGPSLPVLFCAVEDDTSKMNRAAANTASAVLVVGQFT
jgi:D-Tyr-tRNAtyr deacylase